MIFFLKKLQKKGAFHVILGGFLSNFVTFFGSIFLVRVITKEDFGVISYVENIYNYFLIIAGLGLGQALTRYLVLEKTNNGKYSVYLYSIRVGSFINFFIFLISLFFIYYFPHPKIIEENKYILIFSFLTIFFQYIKDTSIYVFRAMFKNKLYTLISLVFTLLFVTSRVLGGYFEGLNGVIFSKLTIQVIFSMLLVIFIKKKFFDSSNYEKIPKLKQREINSYSFQYMISTALWKIFMLNDIFLLGQFTKDLNLVADYKVALVLPGILIVFSNAVGMFVAPYFIKNENNSEWIKINFYRLIIVNTTLIAIATGILYLFMKDIILFVYGENYLSIVSVSKILLLSFFINSSFRFIIAHLLSTMGQVRQNLLISFIGVLLQIILNIILIPILGIYGVAITNLVIYIIMSSWLFWIFKKKYLI